MGRRLSLFVVAVSVLGVAACSSSTTDTDVAAESPTSVAGEDMAVTAERGAELALQMGCASCHTTNGNVSVGPTWQGLFGSQRSFVDGNQVVADEDYLRESIRDPNAKVVEGFLPGIMPQNFGDRLTEGDIDSVIAYIKTLQ